MTDAEDTKKASKAISTTEILLGDICHSDTIVRNSRITEAEYTTLTIVVRELLWIINIINCIPDQHVKKPIPICEDNESAINLTDNYDASKYTRHIGIVHHFLRDYCKGGNRLFDIIYTNTKSNLADGMTKPLAKTAFLQFQQQTVREYI